MEETDFMIYADDSDIDFQNGKPIKQPATTYTDQHGVIYSLSNMTINADQIECEIIDDIFGPSSWKKTKEINISLRASGIKAYDATYRLRLAVLKGQISFVRNAKVVKIRRKWWSIVKFLICRIERDYGVDFGLRFSRTYPIKYACSILFTVAKNTLLHSISNKKSRYLVFTETDDQRSICHRRLPRWAAKAHKYLKRNQEANIIKLIK